MIGKDSSEKISDNNKRINESNAVEYFDLTLFQKPLWEFKI